VEETVGRVTVKWKPEGFDVSRAPKPYFCYKYKERPGQSLRHNLMMATNKISETPTNPFLSWPLAQEHTAASIKVIKASPRPR
jgi:hypothetical protein